MTEAVSVLVTVGDELLLGRTVDTNAAWLGQRLAELGAPLVEAHRAPDQDEAIGRLVSGATDRAPLVWVTGGLGPTDDDRTRPAVARALGTPLEQSADLVAQLEARFHSIGYRHLPESNLRQAMVPRGATVLPNAAGTAPGLAMPVGEGRWVILLPGPPREMRSVFSEAARLVRTHLGGALRPVHVRTLHTTGIAESVLAPRVENALGPARDVEAAFLPDLTGVDVRLIVRGEGDPARAAARLDEAERRVGPVMEGYRFEAPESGDLVEALGRALRSRAWSLAVAESCTGGLVGRRLTELPGASDYFLGGIVAYANRVKVDALGVESAVLERHGAVSGPVAEAMADGVRRALGSDCGLAVTGVAGPDGGTDEKPVGTVWMSVVTPSARRTVEQRFVGDRRAVRVRAAQAALALLLRTVEAGSAPDLPGT